MTAIGVGVLLDQAVGVAAFGGLAVGVVLLLQLVGAVQQGFDPPGVVALVVPGLPQQGDAAQVFAVGGVPGVQVDAVLGAGGESALVGVVLLQMVFAVARFD